MSLLFWMSLNTQSPVTICNPNVSYLPCSSHSLSRSPPLGRLFKAPVDIIVIGSIFRRIERSDRDANVPSMTPTVVQHHQKISFRSFPIRLKSDFVIVQLLGCLLALFAFLEIEVASTKYSIKWVKLRAAVAVTNQQMKKTKIQFPRLFFSLVSFLLCVFSPPVHLATVL